MKTKPHGETEAERIANRILKYIQNPRYRVQEMTYAQLEKKLAGIVDRIAKEIDNPDFTAKVNEFKRIAFYDKDLEDGICEEGLEAKTSNYLKSIQKVFQNGTH
ncbi:MAG: hypothetical protein QW666_02545 [Candidatus Woesearchaeota archaeon]